MNDSCEGILGKLFGHKFRSRFNTATTQRRSDGAIVIQQTYVCDVCVRCGAIVESEYETDVEAKADDDERLATEAEERRFYGKDVGKDPRDT